MRLDFFTFLVRFRSFWSKTIKFILDFGLISTCFRGSGCLEQLLPRLVAIQLNLDTWIYDLRDTDNPIMHFSGTKMTKFFVAKNFQKRFFVSRQIFKHLQLSSQLPGGLLYVYFMNQQQKVDFGSDIPALFWRFRKQSKTTKMAQKLQKWLFSANLSVLSINIS